MSKDTREFSEIVLETKLLIHEVKCGLGEMIESNKRLQELTEQFIKTCDKYLQDSEDKE